MVVFAVSAHRSFLKKQENFPLFSMAYTLLYSVASVLSTVPFCATILAALYFNFTPIPSCLCNQSTSSFFQHCHNGHTRHQNHMMPFNVLVMTSLQLLTQTLKKMNKSRHNQYCLPLPGASIFATHTVSRWGADVDEQPFPLQSQTCYSYVAYCFLFSFAHSTKCFQGLNITVNCRHIAFPTALLITSKVCLVCSSLISFLFKQYSFVDICVFSPFLSQRNLTTAVHQSQGLIWQSRMILPFAVSSAILFFHHCIFYFLLSVNKSAETDSHLL